MVVIFCYIVRSDLKVIILFARLCLQVAVPLPGNDTVCTDIYVVDTTISEELAASFFKVDEGDLRQSRR